MTDASNRALPPVPLHGLLFDVAGASAQGPRKENQDAFDVDAFVTRGVVAVADGMGGERAGRLAADTALSALMQGAEIRSLDSARYAVRHADEAVARLAQQSPDERGGMGCALALMALSVDRGGDLGWIGAHVGDVRILSRGTDGTVRLETRDHTPAYARWEAGEIALDEIPDSPGANKLQRAVGRGGEADAAWIPARAGWSYLLVSDGVTKATRVEELGEIMTLPAAEACRAVMRKVAERGPDDNYTVVAVRVLPDGDRDAVTQEAPPPRPAAAVLADRTVPDPSRRGPFNPPDAVTPPRRSSPLGALALVLALLGIAAGGWAAWRVYTMGEPAPRAAVDSLKARVDSIAGVLPPDTARPDSVPPTDTARGAAPAPARPGPTTKQ
jgi:protein phosphatase